MTVKERTKPQVATMNAVHDLPVLVARDKGFFKDEGLDLEFVTTPGMAQVTTSHFVKFDSVFDRPLDSVYNEGGIDQYRMCEWGIMKRAVEANTQGLRGRKIVALGASMSKFAIVVARDSKYYEPEMLKDKPIAVTPNNGSDFTTLKMMEGFLAQEHVKRTNAGSMLKRLEAVRDGKVAAASLMEPWISVAQKWGLRILIESHSTRSEAAGDDLDGPTLAKMFRAQARAVKEIEKDPTPYVHYFIRETGGLLEPHEFQSWRLLHAAPQPYTRERFEDTYNWTVKWNMTVPGATFENTVGNRAWNWRGNNRRQLKEESTMKRLSVIAMGLLVMGVFGCSYMPWSDAGWTTLIDGTSGLENFNPIGDANWRAENGAIVADKGKGGYLVSKKSYKDFQIRAEFWADHTTNSGVFLRVTNRNKVTATYAYEVKIYEQRPDPDYGTVAIVNVSKVETMPRAV